MHDKGPQAAASFIEKNWLRIAVVLSGPLLAVFLYAGTAGRSLPFWGLLGIICLIIGGAACAVALSYAIHRVVRQFLGAVAISLLAIEMFFVAALATGVLLFGGPEGIAWLPVSLVVLVLFTAPMAVLIAFAVGRMVRDP